MSCFCRGWQSPLGDVCMCMLFLGQHGQVKRVFCVWWNRWDPYSHWHAILPLAPPHQCALHLHNTNRSIKESQILFVFISFISKRFFILSYPGHHIAFLCFKAKFRCASFFFFLQCLNWNVELYLKRGHMNVRCRLRRRRLNLFSNEAGQKQVALPIVVRTRLKWTYVVRW